MALFPASRPILTFLLVSYLLNSMLVNLSNTLAKVSNLFHNNHNSLLSHLNLLDSNNKCQPSNRSLDNLNLLDNSQWVVNL